MTPAQKLDNHLRTAIAEFTGSPSPAELRRAPSMSKLQSVADRIRDTKAMLDAEADKLAARLDTLDKIAPTALDRAHTFVSQQHTDVEGMETTLRQLTNLPLDGSASSPDEPAKG